MFFINLITILTADDIVLSINNNLNYLLCLIPELKYMIGFEHKHPHHHLDVWEHTLYALSLSENDFEIRLCLLLHDIGKPFSYTEGDVRYFHGHAEVSKIMSEKILKRLGFNDDFINEVCYLIKNHDTKLTMEEIEKNYWLAHKRYLIQYCDAMAHNSEKLEKRKTYLLNIKNLLDK